MHSVPTRKNFHQIFDKLDRWLFNRRAIDKLNYFKKKNTINLLKAHFDKNQYPSEKEITELSAAACLPEKKISTLFTNRYKDNHLKN